MQKKSDDFSTRQAKELANSPAGQQLLALLRSRGGNQLQQILQQLQKGQYQQAGKALQNIVSQQEILDLLGRKEDG